MTRFLSVLSATGGTKVFHTRRFGRMENAFDKGDEIGHNTVCCGTWVLRMETSSRKSAGDFPGMQKANRKSNENKDHV